jgi:alpha-beta hydrolase superfamily lysophospholipase
MSLIDEHLAARLAAGVYEQWQPPAYAKVLHSGEVGNVQFDIHLAGSTIWICYAGSNEPSDWIRHALVRRKRLPRRYQTTSNNLSAHQGWLADATKTMQVLHDTVGRWRYSCRLVFCGHSYGGPLATLAAYMTSREWIGADIAIRTYGSPAAGSRAFAEAVDRSIPNHVRYANPKDIVTRLPVGRYRHSGILSPVLAGWPGHKSDKYRDWIIDNEPQFREKPKQKKEE